MKNLSLILNAVLILAVGLLYYLHFNSVKEVEPQKSSIVESSEYAVAFINADTVLQNYDFFKNKQAELDIKSKKLQNEYKNRAEGLQKEVNDYQSNVNNLTIAQAKAVEENLMKKQQNLRMYQETLSQELMKDESKINKELYEKVTGFLRGYSEKNGLELVVKYNQGSDIMYANDSMDITKSVITGLNEAYKNESKLATETEAESLSGK